MTLALEELTFNWKSLSADFPNHIPCMQLEIQTVKGGKHLQGKDTGAI